MATGMLRTIMIAIVAAGVAGGAFATDSQRPRHQPAPAYGSAASPRDSQSTLNTPGQTTVLTREILDDKNATTLNDALRSTAGVTVGR
jgi:outer membrane receptor for monomeric catechols